MNKYIIIITIVLFGVGAVALLNATGETGTNGASKESNEIEQVSQLQTTEQDTYAIDPSDMYSPDPPQEAVSASELTEKEETWLIHMREEEKLARDVYSTLGDMWDMQIFSNIAKAEQTHTDSIKVLLNRYGITDPVSDDTVGVFTLPEIQTLYDELVAQGSTSLLDALVVGATIEDLDINDLDIAMEETDTADIDVVYANLQKGSRNHMRAFIKNIERQGSTYSPVYISETEFQDIISSAQERGRL